jgi:HTH-type transcriptional regulator / antitoxin HigA
MTPEHRKQRALEASCKFNPDWLLPPGDVLLEHLEARRMRQSVFSRLCKLSPKHINLVARGKAPLTVPVAMIFERVLGVDASIWMNLETSYRIALERKKKK